MSERVQWDAALRSGMGFVAKGRWHGDNYQYLHHSPSSIIMAYGSMMFARRKVSQVSVKPGKGTAASQQNFVLMSPSALQRNPKHVDQLVRVVLDLSLVIDRSGFRATKSHDAPSIATLLIYPETLFQSKDPCIPTKTALNYLRRKQDIPWDISTRMARLLVARPHSQPIY